MNERLKSAGQPYNEWVGIYSVVYSTLPWNPKNTNIYPKRPPQEKENLENNENDVCASIKPLRIPNRCVWKFSPSFSQGFQERAFTPFRFFGKQDSAGFSSITRENFDRVRKILDSKYIFESGGDRVRSLIYSLCDKYFYVLLTILMSL